MGDATASARKRHKEFRSFKIPAFQKRDHHQRYSKGMEIARLKF